MLRRRTPMKPSRGTTWPPDVREHVRSHRPVCIGPLANMLGFCSGSTELDHIRASGGIGMKSKSIATNAAPLCSVHHDIKTREGRVWRPLLLTVMRAILRGCSACEAEYVREWGVSIDAASYVDEVPA